MQWLHVLVDLKDLLLLELNIKREKIFISLTNKVNMHRKTIYIYVFVNTIQVMFYSSQTEIWYLKHSLCNVWL